MCSSPIQVKKVFLYSSFFCLVITFCICLIGLFVCVGNPKLSVIGIWNYIIASVPPFFRVSVAICILGMAMSTVDFYLHFCSVMVAHDLMEGIRGVKPISDMLQIRVAKLALLVSGLLSMILAIYFNRDLVCYAYDLCMAVIAPPFILAVFGFRGTARTALIGMVIPFLIMLTYKKWCPVTGGQACIISVLANGLGMMVAHYLLPQPLSTGWVGLDAQQKRLQQLARVFKRYRKRADLE